MHLVLQTANVKQDETNSFYPNHADVANADEMREAVRMDHVCAEYRNCHRSNDDFIRSSVVVMDCDNDHSEDPDEWITSKKLNELLPDISYVLVPSRHHMKPKGKLSARPRFHVYFPIDEITDPSVYAGLKRGIYQSFPFFDNGAIDSARFIYGSDPETVVWHDGWVQIDEEIAPVMDEECRDCGQSNDGSDSQIIPEGSRNNTMSHFAGRVLKKYGITKKAQDAFLEHSKRCDPPLGARELKTIWGSAVRFYRNKVMMQPGYVPPDEYNAEFGSLKPDDYSDIGEARVLVKEYSDELKYTDATEFLSYDGICWRENRQKAVGAVEEFLDMQLVDAKTQLEEAMKVLTGKGVPENIVKAGGKTLEKNITPDLKKEFVAFLAAKTYLAFVMKYRNYKNIVNTQNAAKPMVAADVNDFDTQENYLNTPAATYDLEKGLAGVMPHRSTDLLTKITNASPGDEGKQLWDDALQLFFCGDPDLIDYVQETVGLAAIGKVYEEALIIAYGEGRNGKSTFWNTISRVLGTYAGAISADALTAGCRRNVKPEIAELKGKRLIIAAELEEGMRLSTSILKQLCSTDQIRGEKKFKDPFDFIPSHTVVLYTNHLPKVGASDEGTWRRLIVIPFNAKIEGKSDIKNYSDYLFNHAAPAIMSWIIEGAAKVIGHDHVLKKPDVVVKAIAEYRGMNDWMGIFLNECCETGDGLECKSGELYEEFRAYCQRTGEYARCNADFTLELEKRGYFRKKKKSGMWVQGVQLKNEDFVS